MIIKFVANAIKNCFDYALIVDNADEIHVGINTSEQPDPCKEEKAMPNSVRVRYPGEMSYIERFNGSFRRVYGCSYSEGPKNTGTLSKKIDRTDERNKRRDGKRKRNRKVPTKVDMNEDFDNLILIAVGHFGLPSYMADRTKLIMYNMWSYPDNFHGLRYENVVLGILMYVVYESLSEAVTVDFNRYCTYMFGIERAERNIRQMYQAYMIVCDLYEGTERELME